MRADQSAPLAVDHEELVVVSESWANQSLETAWDSERGALLGHEADTADP